MSSDLSGANLSGANLSEAICRGQGRGFYPRPLAQENSSVWGNRLGGGESGRQAQNLTNLPQF
ncbi:pentapeptide repeat-containing protein [Nodosilinea sp. PGN35]|uniref:pentapeptide repeat-containing protein n=1 Tax=Nodosilinea sp. PGN35 TaxID=3020489 RepID=UPI00351D95E1